MMFTVHPSQFRVDRSAKRSRLPLVIALSFLTAMAVLTIGVLR